MKEEEIECCGSFGVESKAVGVCGDQNEKLEVEVNCRLLLV